MPHCDECNSLEQACSDDSFDTIVAKAKKWINHFNSKPNLINLGSTNALSDFFGLMEDNEKTKGGD